MSAAADAIFPRFCVGCGAEGTLFCEDCMAKAADIDMDKCPKCNRRAPALDLCDRCRRLTGLEQLVYLGRFEEALRDALHALKYEDTRLLSVDIATALCCRIQKMKLLEGLIVPVPISRKRQLERGYNQSALIARQLAQQLGWHYLDALVRTKDTQPQTKLCRADRAENVKDAFLSKYCFTDKNRIIYLLDDVVTTGATMSESIRALKKAGVKNIVAVAVATAK